MILLQRLYTEPQYFEPIIFSEGINLIIGDRSDKSNKTNSVGKSMCIEFINYCLLKDAKYSRVTKIPENKFPLDIKIKLDFKINNKQLTIIRTRKDADNVIIISNGQELFFHSIQDASKYLQNLLFENHANTSTFLSFRQLIAPLMRDERSEFKNLIKTYDTDKSIPSDYLPHIYFLGFDISIFQEYKKIVKEIENETKFLNKLKEEITENDNLSFKDAKAKLNALEDEVKKLNNAIESLRTNEAFDSIHKDLIQLETELETLRTKQKALKYEIKKIETLPKPENISPTELTILYNQFKSGLGDLIEKSLIEVQEFKDKIDNFRNSLVNNKLDILKNELNQLAIKISEKDKLHSDKLKSIDNGKILKDLKTVLGVYNKKSEELNKIRYQLTTYDEKFKHRRDILIPRLSEVKQSINKQINDNEKIIKNFEQTILSIHETIMNNREASFNIDTKNSSKSKDYIEFSMRIDDDRGHSTERTRVFIYDIALMFNEFTKLRHPRLLIHDNIFDVDQDTLVQCLNYLYKQEELYQNEFQYILTINRDKIENEERLKLINMDIASHRKANFTKANRFLGFEYKEK